MKKKIVAVFITTVIAVTAATTPAKAGWWDDFKTFIVSIGVMGGGFRK